MMVQDSTKNHTPLEAIHSKLQKLQEPSLKVSFNDDESQK